MWACYSFSIYVLTPPLKLLTKLSSVDHPSFTRATNDLGPDVQDWAGFRIWADEDDGVSSKGMLRLFRCPFETRSKRVRAPGLEQTMPLYVQCKTSVESPCVTKHR